MLHYELFKDTELYLLSKSDPRQCSLGSVWVHFMFELLLRTYLHGNMGDSRS